MLNSFSPISTQPWGPGWVRSAFDVEPPPHSGCVREASTLFFFPKGREDTHKKNTFFYVCLPEDVNPLFSYLDTTLRSWMGTFCFWGRAPSPLMDRFYKNARYFILTCYQRKMSNSFCSYLDTTLRSWMGTFCCTLLETCSTSSMCKTEKPPSSGKRKRRGNFNRDLENLKKSRDF